MSEDQVNLFFEEVEPLPETPVSEGIHVIWKSVSCKKTPPARGGHSMSYVGGKFYLFGGNTRTGHFFDDLHVYDPESCEWDEISIPSPARKPAGRAGHSAVIYNNQIVIYGGQAVSDTGFIFFDDVWSFDTDKQMWAQLQTKSGSCDGSLLFRNAHLSVLKGVHMVVLGGSNENGPISTMHSLNLESLCWTEVSASGEEWIPREMIAHTTTYTDNQVLVWIGGGRGMDGACDDMLRVCISEPSSPTETQTSEIHATLTKHGLCPHICGGTAIKLHNNNNNNNNNNSTEEKKEVSILSDPVEDCFVVFGGTDMNAFLSKTIVRLSASKWVELPPTGPVPPERFAHTLTQTHTHTSTHRDEQADAQGECKAILFGGMNPQTDLNDMYTCEIKYM